MCYSVVFSNGAVFVSFDSSVRYGFNVSEVCSGHILFKLKFAEASDEIYFSMNELALFA